MVEVSEYISSYLDILLVTIILLVLCYYLKIKISVLFMSLLLNNAADYNSLWREPDGTFWAKVRWYIIPEETAAGRQPHNLWRELYHTNDFADIEVIIVFCVYCWLLHNFLFDCPFVVLSSLCNCVYVFCRWKQSLDIVT